MLDIYFEPLYGKISERILDGKSETFNFENEYGSISHLFVKREIPIKINCVTYYDLIGPYGYGGPIIEECSDKSKASKLVDGFHQAFGEYCKKNNIVSEYVAFHPIFKNHEDFKSIYDIQLHKITLGTNLRDYDDPYTSEFSKQARKTVRRALREGVTYKIITNPTSIKNFKEIYYSTMNRNEVGNFYYFDEQYFDDLLKSMNQHIILCEAIYDNKIIAMGFYFKYNKIIHAHLSGTLDEYLYLSPAYILKYGTTIWGKDNGYNFIHYGGGISNDLNDSLYKFKKRFSENTEFELFNGKRIWNQKIYNDLCDLRGIGKGSAIGFFPAYRYDTKVSKCENK